MASIKKKSISVDWNKAPDIRKMVNNLIDTLEIAGIKKSSVYCVRSQNSSSKAYARIWGLPKIWQLSLSTEPAYIIEVLSEKFDKLSQKEKDKILIHELAHIPRNFSGSLLPHIKKRGKRNFNDRVKIMVKRYQNQKI